MALLSKGKKIFSSKKDTVYLFYSGKGGVGKTSIAAASALKYSEKGKKTLIISVDPAHSLSDSFEKKIGGEITEIVKNLSAVEIDPAMAMEEYKKKLSPQLEGMESLKGLGLGDLFDMVGKTPGIDEIAAFDKFLQYMHQKEWDVIIFDTAPTGHALRFLSLPEVLDSWVGKMIKMRMQFSGMINIVKKVLPFGNPGEENPGMEQLEKMKKRIEEARIILEDPKKTHYNLVLIPEMMSIQESGRSLKVLKQYKIPVDTIFLNQIIPTNSSCSFCTGKRSQQLKRVGDAKNIFSHYRLVQLPLFKDEVRGLSMLKKLGALLT